MTPRRACGSEIAINEAIEMARKFATTELAAFVNGVLDEVGKRLGLKDVSSMPRED